MFFVLGEGDGGGVCGGNGDGGWGREKGREGWWIV